MLSHAPTKPANRSRDFDYLASFGPRRWHSICAACVTAVGLALAGCAAEEEETVELVNPLDSELLDDSAPAPTPYDESLTYEDRGGYQANHSTDRYRFDVAAYRDAAEQQRAEQLFPNHAEFLAAHHAVAIPSVQTIGTYLKQIDDTIYAGVEAAVQEGLQPTVESKRAVLSGALAYLVDHRSASADEGLVHVAAALELGGDSPSVPADLQDEVQALEDEFLARTIEAKPIGFYTWSERLRQIWRQDRLLQRALPSPQGACALAEALAADADRRMRYEQLLELYARMTNPLRSTLADRLDVATQADCSALGNAAFLSASRTPEVELFEQLYPNGVPADADLMGDLIEAIRQGTVDLAPQPEDGWYQHQLHALETLLVTDRSEERAKIAFMARYKKRLQEAFSTMLVQHRETHVKQADVLGEAAAYMPDLPNFRLEPLATVYVRHARSYVFLEAALDEVMGPAFLDDAVAVDAEGNTDESLRKRIGAARDLCYGLYLLSCQDIGLPYRLDSSGDPEPEQWNALADAADRWLLELERDDVAASDVRVMVPIAALGGGRAKYWAVLGVRATVAGYSYLHGDDVSPPAPADEARLWLPTEQFLEVESSATPLTRDEFRELCDQQRTAAAIQAALEAR